MILKHNGMEIKRGNAKMSDNTLIFNMTTATDCPSKKLGLCKVPNWCYAFNNERLYKDKGPRPYRERQEKYWDECTSSSFMKDFAVLMKRHKKALSIVKFLRFNEAGDFKSQKDVRKADLIATKLKQKYDIVTYCHTARSDLNFSNCKTLLVKGSGHDKGNNGRSDVTNDKSIVKSHSMQMYSYDGRNVFVCPETSCGDVCSYCRVNNGKDVLFTRH